MSNYKIEIEEWYLRQLNIEADSFDDAVEKVHDLYKSNKLNAQDLSIVGYKIKDGNEDESKDALIKGIISYLYRDEKRHYEEFGDDKPEDHIYLKLVKLLKMID